MIKKRILLPLIIVILLVGSLIIYKTCSSKNTEWAKGKLLSSDGTYDVIVVGSDPEGICAAVSAARSGAKTLLLGKESVPGGLLVCGMLNTIDMNRNKKGEILSQGIFNEFYKSIGNTESFDVNTAKITFEKLINNEKNLTYLKNMSFKNPIMENKSIIGIETENGEKFNGKRIIDATRDGDIAVAAGAPFTIGMEDVDLTEKMATTLVFKVGGINWSELGKDVENYKKTTGDQHSGFNESTAWAFGDWCYDKYTPLHSNMRLRGLNIGKQEDGTILINALQIFNIDGLNNDQMEKAKAEGKEEIDNVITYLKTILPSFKNAYIAGVAEDLYIRETRHVIGEYVLKTEDILGNKNFYDKIALASYPIDIQSTGPNNTGYVIGSPDQYSIPLRCLIPLNVENLFIVGRAASYSSVAAGSARVVPTGMTCGESAGIAAVYSIVKNITPRALSQDTAEVQNLTKILKEQGVYLPEFSLKDPNADYPGYEQIKKLVNLGFLSGGYNNNFSFDKDATVGSLCMSLINGFKRSKKDCFSEAFDAQIRKYWSTETLTGSSLAKIICDIKNEPVSEMSNEQIWESFSSKNLLGMYKDNINKDSKITTGQMYYIVSTILDTYPGGKNEET